MMVLPISALQSTVKETRKRVLSSVKKGALLKQLGAEARADIQKLLATKVYLDLWVKVKKDWRNKSGMLSELGYRK